MKRVGSVVKLLKEAKQPQSDFVKLMDSFKDPYLVLIACILSLRTNDRTTYPATLRMLELAKTPQEMMRVNVGDLEKAIYPVGFYKNKAGQIIELSKLIVEKYEGKGYGDFKSDLAEIVANEVGMVQEKFNYWFNSEELDRVLNEGKMKAEYLASKKMAKIKKKFGYGR